MAKQIKGSFPIKDWSIENLDHDSLVNSGCNITIKGKIPVEFKKIIKEYNLQVDNSHGDKTLFLDKQTFQAVYLYTLNRKNNGLITIEFGEANCVITIKNTGDDYKPNYILYYSI